MIATVVVCCQSAQQRSPVKTEQKTNIESHAILCVETGVWHDVKISLKMKKSRREKINKYLEGRITADYRNALNRQPTKYHNPF